MKPTIKKFPKGLSEPELVKKYEAGKVNFGKIAQQMLNKPSPSAILKSKNKG